MSNVLGETGSELYASTSGRKHDSIATARSRGRPSYRRCDSASPCVIALFLLPAGLLCARRAL